MRKRVREEIALRVQLRSLYENETNVIVLMYDYSTRLDIQESVKHLKKGQMIEPALREIAFLPVEMLGVPDTNSRAR